MRAMLLGILLIVASPQARSAELLVHAAATFADALREVAELHDRETGVTTRLHLGASSTLARQILAGAPGDVFLSADEQRMDQLEAAGLLMPGTRRSLLSNELVVVVAADSPLTLATSRDLALPVIGSLTLADPLAVPAGLYAREHLQRMGTWDLVATKVIPAENVRAALAAVEAGNADAAIVYATDARASTRARVACLIPAEEAPDISHPVAALADASDPVRARAFVTFLASPAAIAIFERHGFRSRR